MYLNCTTRRKSADLEKESTAALLFFFIAQATTQFFSRHKDTTPHDQEWKIGFMNEEEWKGGCYMFSTG